MIKIQTPPIIYKIFGLNNNKVILEQTHTPSYSSSLAMPRNKVIFALIVNETDRKVSYKN
ncbi:hypothetical protein H5410_030690 [Solanum commersonii]|uniref:Uncharacterized protein n=1 Tax=Solanum commersonii TaxID=4109 RepID=A0A9J5YI52_SOLCO|nr:hypothetical protein H5410_030690 [Solanum commersonii]